MNPRQEITNFTTDWNWEKVVVHLENRYREASVSPADLFQEIEVCDPFNLYDRQRVIDWCEIGKVAAAIHSLQKHLILNPGSPDTNLDCYRTGEIETLRFLWQLYDANRSVIPILVAASIFRRIGSARSRYPSEWVPVCCVVPLRDWAQEALADRIGWGGISSPWHHTRTQVLPSSECIEEPRISSMDSLLNFIASEHIELFRSYRALRINFMPKINVFLKKRIHHELGWKN